MVKVDGTDDIVDLIPAPGTIYEDGTFRNKANDLTDATAALFGFGSAAVQNDVFEYLGKYAQHWWSVVYGKERTAYVEHLNPSWTNNDFLNITSSGKGSVQVASSVDIDQTTGAVSLHSPTTYTVTSQHDDAGKAAMASAIRGRYILGANFSPNNIYFIPAGTSIDYSAANVVIRNYYQPVYAVQSTQTIIPAGKTTYVRSSDRNAYTEGEDANGNVYSYLGIPFDNSIVPVKTATGSYAGTDTYGESNPNSLTFDFEPKVVVITSIVPDSESVQMGILTAHGGMVWNGEYDRNTSGGTYSQPALNSAINGNTVTWYSNNANQLNSLGKIYHYFAIG